jgi:hypothetical protein
MRLIPVKLFAIAIVVVLPVQAKGADSTDALIVLTTVGYLIGAADGCKVVPKESNQLSSGMAIAIARRSYGDPAQAHLLFNNARQKGIEEAGAGKVNCAKVGDSVQQQVRTLLSR